MFTTETRKRKQDEMNSTLPTNWTDFIYSTPSSPSIDNLFDQHSYSFDSSSGTNSRRHSVAVGELDYHSFDLNSLLEERRERSTSHVERKNV